MLRLFFTWPNLVVRALDDFHQIARAAKRIDDLAQLSEDIAGLTKRLASLEPVLVELGRAARTTDTVLKAMPGSKVVAQRAKRATRSSSSTGPKPAAKPRSPKA